MSNPATLSINQIVDVSVQISPTAAPRPTFNQALFIGTSTVIPSVGTNSRIRMYSSVAQMLSDGFDNADPEVIAAELYFDQSPAPDILWVGRQDLTALKTVIPNSGNEGTDYEVGDILTVVQSGGSLGTVRVASVVAETGAIATLTVPVGGAGTGYGVASGLSTTGGSGTGAKVDITAIGETPLVALEVCRAANYLWYVAVCLAAVKADHLECAAYIESAEPSSIYAFTTDDADVPTNTAGNIFAALKALLYSRTFGQYSTASDYAVCAILGYAMGQNTGTENSAYTLMFKGEVGIATEPLTQTELGNICGVGPSAVGNYGNVYVSFGNYYNIFMKGTMSNGQYFDEILNLDMLVSDIQLNVMDLLYGTPKVPQTDAGVSQIVHAINQALELAVTRGFLAPGTWTAAPVMNIATGDALPKGYVVQAQAIAQQARADREARKSPPIYIACKEAGAIHYVIVITYVNR